MGDIKRYIIEATEDDERRKELFDAIMEYDIYKMVRNATTDQLALIGAELFLREKALKKKERNSIKDKARKIIEERNKDGRKNISLER